MAGIILTILTLAECILAVISIVKKKNNIKLRAYYRLGLLSLFMVLTLTSIIEWSFRWFLLSAWLFILAIVSLISLVRNKKKTSYKPIKMVVKTIAACIILGIALVPALVFPQYKQPQITGEYGVNTTTYSYIDKSRLETFTNTGENRKVTVDFYYPDNTTEKYPLIVFSHGAFGVSSSNTSTYYELASNGYIVCSISHPYHSMMTEDTEGNLTFVDKSFMQQVVDVNNGVYNDEQVFKLEQKWLKVRIDDINFALNTIINKANATSSNGVYRFINTSKIGLIGHSLGGAASVQLGRDRSDIAAVINLDGDLLGEYIDYVDDRVIVNNKIYPLPLFSIYTDDMMRLINKSNQLDINTAHKAISTTALKYYETHFKGTNHMSLTDLPLFSPFMVKMISGQIKNSNSSQKTDKYYVIETMNSIILDFYDFFLKGKGNFNPASSY